MRPAGSDAGAPRAPVGVYVHFPFCSVRCSYCDFPTVAGRDDRIERYLRALSAEIGTQQLDAGTSADTVFLGGGTPSRRSAGQVLQVLAALRRRFALAADAEITLEGNPESLTRPALEGLLGAGVNRISVGVQSLDDRVLRRAGRAHGVAEAETAVREARLTGFPSVSLDLIAGLPGEDLSRWGETVRRAAGLGPDHVSVYLLETDKDAPLARAVRSGRVAVADDDRLAEAYETTVRVLEGEGLALYEISNFARAGHASRHNLKYWTDRPYAGYGLGAHGYVDGARRANRKDLDGYLEDVEAGRSPRDWEEPFDPRRRLEEALFLGLRTAEGVDLEVLGARYGADPRALFAGAWDRGLGARMIAFEGARVRLTPSGRLRSNALFAELV